MGFELKPNAVNQIPRGTGIFLENEQAEFVCIIIKGRVLAKNDSVKLSLPAGSFFGVFDLSAGHYKFDYIAIEDSMLYAFPILMQNIKYSAGKQEKEPWHFLPWKI